MKKLTMTLLLLSFCAVGLTKKVNNYIGQLLYFRWAISIIFIEGVVLKQIDQE